MRIQAHLQVPSAALSAVLLGLPLALAAPAAAQDGSSPTAASSEATPEVLPGTWHLQQHVLKDAGWGNQPSHTVLAPAGWKVEGGAWYPPAQAFKTFASHEVTLTGPDGSLIELGPDMNFVDKTYVTMNGPQRLPSRSLDGGAIVLHLPKSPRGFGNLLKDLLAEDRPDAKRIRLVSAEEVPALTAQLRQALAPSAQRFRQFGQTMQGVRTVIDASVIGVEFEYQEDGRKWSHAVLFAHTSFGYTMPSALNQMGIPGSDSMTSWSISGSLGVRAPKGELEDLATTALVVQGTLRATPAWAQMQARHRAKIQKISHEIAMDNIRTAANISRISARASSEVLDIGARGHAKRGALSDEGQAKLVNSIHEVHEYRVPGEDLPVALPSYYDRVFSNGQGEFILTNDTQFTPGSDLSLKGDWGALERVR